MPGTAIGAFIAHTPCLILHSDVCTIHARISRSWVFGLTIQCSSRHTKNGISVQTRTCPSPNHHLKADHKPLALKSVSNPSRFVPLIQPPASTTLGNTLVWRHSAAATISSLLAVLSTICLGPTMQPCARVGMSGFTYMKNGNMLTACSISSLPEYL